MTADVAPIQVKEASFNSSLYQDSYTQNHVDHSFQQYLEEEQKRLAFLFSPWGQFNFSSWFSYPDFSLKAASGEPELFSDSHIIPPEYLKPNASENQIAQPGTEQSQPLGTYSFSSNQPQLMLQDLLMKAGWLVPNLEIYPQFYQAQLQGKLLNKLDLQFLVDQILSQVKIVKEKGKVELTLGLKPENLGEILLILTSRSGMVSIQIQAPEETRKLIEANLKELELALKRANINLEGIKIANLKEVNKDV